MTAALLLFAWALQAPPDSATRAHVSNRLSALTDSLTVLSGAIARYRRDADKASDVLMASRAGEVRAGCTAALTAADSLTRTLEARRYIPRDDRYQRALQVELGALRQSLRTCRREWDTTSRGARADSVRAWGPYRLAQLARVVQKYEFRANTFHEHLKTEKPAAAR